jgi:2',3'-cyclic-nucleotide 2'-phosphodiesterase (5'-nucleotidase family)
MIKMASNKNNFLWLLAVFIFLLSACARKKSFVIYYFGDVKGFYGTRHDDTSGRKMGGYEVLKNMLKAEKSNYLLLSNGNWFSGTPEGVYKNGKFSVDLMNLAGVDAAGIDETDFSFGVKSLKSIIENAKFHVLASNLYDKKKKKSAEFVSPFFVKEINEVKVGIFALTGRFLSTSFLRRKLGKYELTGEINSARRAVEKLKKKGASFIIALMQGGKAADDTSFDAGAVSLARQVEGIDLIILAGNKSGTKVPLKAGNTLIVRSGKHLLDVGRLEPEFNSFTGKLTGYGYRRVDLDPQKFGRNKEISLFIDSLRRKTDNAFAGQVAFAPHAQGRSDMGNWVCDCIRRWAKVSAVLLEPENIKSGIGAGKVTKRDLYKIIPYNSNIVFVKIRGADLKKALEKDISSSADRFKTSGLKVYFDPNAHPGEKIKSIYVGGVALRENKIYKIAVSDNMLYGRNFYYSFEFANTYENIRYKLLWCMRKEKVLRIANRDRWVETED